MPKKIRREEETERRGEQGVAPENTWCSDGSQPLRRALLVAVVGGLVAMKIAKRDRDARSSAPSYDLMYARSVPTSRRADTDARQIQTRYIEKSTKES